VEMCDGGCNHCHALSSASVLLGAGVSNERGRSRLHRQLQLMSFQYGNLGPHGQ
jgi:hypothetical protein